MVWGWYCEDKQHTSHSYDTVKRNNILVTLMGQRVNSSLESKRAEPACCAFAVLTHPCCWNDANELKLFRFSVTLEVTRKKYYSYLLRDKMSGKHVLRFFFSSFYHETICWKENMASSAFSFTVHKSTYNHHGSQIRHKIKRFFISTFLFCVF